MAWSQFFVITKLASLAFKFTILVPATSAAYLSADLLRPQTELKGKLCRASVICIKKISRLTIVVHTSGSRYLQMNMFGSNEKF